MKIRLTKDYRHYEILYDSQEEAQAIMEYQEQLLVRGFVEKIDLPPSKRIQWWLHKIMTPVGFVEKADLIKAVEEAEWQHEQENSTGNK